MFYRDGNMNILLITTQYPCFDSTNRVHSEYMHMYNRAFVKRGNSVTVFHLERKYPFIMTFIASILIRISKRLNRLLRLYLGNDEIKRDNYYKQDGVSIFRVIVKKYVPHGNFSRRSIIIAKKKMNSIITNRDICPDIVIAEFANPSLLFVGLFPNATFVFSPHGSDMKYLHNNRKLRNIACQSKLILAKSSLQARQLASFFDFKKIFMLFGLVPNSLFSKEITFRKHIQKFITVSRLVRGKNIISVIDALAISGLQEFEYQIIGDGPDRDNIRNHIDKSVISSHCHLLGSLTKEEVFSRMNSADCFIMISDNETFGLVYIEAMASGCITIGSRNEGIDGVIIDGVNGYLCPAGNAKYLAQKIIMIANETEDKLECISTAGYFSAKNLSDELYPDVIMQKLCEVMEEQT